MNMVIGKSLNNGWAGNYPQQPNMVIRTFPVNKDSSPIFFGDPVMLDGDTVIKAGATVTSDTFLGIAAAEVVSQISTLETSGQYVAESAASIMVQGIVNVVINDGGSPKKGDSVYIQTADGASGEKIGDFATSKTADTVEIKNCVFMSGKDANNVASVEMKTINLV